MEDPVVPLELNLYGHRLAGLVERQFEKILLQHGWRKFPIGNVFWYTVEKDCSYLCMIADVISSLVWALAGGSKLPENCAPLCELVEAKEVQITHIIAWHDYERCLFAGLTVGALFARLFLWLVPSLRVLAQQQCRWADPVDRTRQRGVVA